MYDRYHELGDIFGGELSLTAHGLALQLLRAFIRVADVIAKVLCHGSGYKAHPLSLRGMQPRSPAEVCGNRGERPSLRAQN